MSGHHHGPAHRRASTRRLASVVEAFEDAGAETPHDPQQQVGVADCGQVVGVLRDREPGARGEAEDGSVDHEPYPLRRGQEDDERHLGGLRPEGARGVVPRRAEIPTLGSLLPSCQARQS